jgi:exopolyphosphatase/guanosine-5'-triphosphate,3'-diphosphate pyrophosphatase
VKVAALDLGSNSIRLLVLDEHGADVVRRADVTGLGRGLHARGTLSSEGRSATLSLLAGHRRLLDEHGVARLRVVATAAARRASDAPAFLAEAADALGAPVEVLAGIEEARLSFTGATADLALDDDHPVLVVDIGGGSTELAAGGSTLHVAASVDLGCVTLTDAELGGDPPRPEELSNAIGTAADAFADVWVRHPELRRADRLVGVGGTVTTLAAVELGLSAYDRARVHGLELGRDVVEEVFRTLATEPFADRVHNPGLPADRAGVIVGGLCLLVALMRNAPAPSLRVADADLLDAIAHGLRAD